MAKHYADLGRCELLLILVLVTGLYPVQRLPHFQIPIHFHAQEEYAD